MAKQSKRKIGENINRDKQRDRQMQWRHTQCQMPENAKRALLCNH